MARIVPKTPAELAKMRRAGRIVAEALEMIRREAKTSVTTGSLDGMVEDLIRSRDAVPAFKGYRGFPASICTSINEQVVHGIPGQRRLKDGDVLSVDVGVFCDGYAADAAVTMEIGDAGEEARRQIRVGREALDAALAVIRSGVRLSQIGLAVQSTARAAGFNVVRKYTGHGIGREMHEYPQVPNFATSWHLSSGPELPRGATIAVEPMVTAGTSNVEELEDGWTVVTKDRRLAVHVEHTLVVEDHGAVILTTL